MECGDEKSGRGVGRMCIMRLNAIDAHDKRIMCASACSGVWECVLWGSGRWEGAVGGSCGMWEGAVGGVIARVASN
jgi:hypothetical protein